MSDEEEDELDLEWECDECGITDETYGFPLVEGVEEMERRGWRRADDNSPIALLCPSCAKGNGE